MAVWFRAATRDGGDRAGTRKRFQTSAPSPRPDVTGEEEKHTSHHPQDSTPRSWLAGWPLRTSRETWDWTFIGKDHIGSSERTGSWWGKKIMNLVSSR